jgi:hypothetical protein
MCAAPAFRFFTADFYGSREDHEVLPLQIIPQIFIRIPFFIRMITSIIKIVIANGLPTAEGKSEVWIHSLITGC